VPLTAKGRKIKRKMKQQYGVKKAEQVVHASRNAGTIQGVEARGMRHRATVRRMTGY